MRCWIAIAIGLLTCASAGAAVPPKMDVVKMANCSAAAMKSGDRALWNEWLEALTKRYQSIYPEKARADAERYAISRVQDKRRRLQQQGLDSGSAARDYMAKNCQK